jgi:hypothetical protein
MCVPPPLPFASSVVSAPSPPLLLLLPPPLPRPRSANPSNQQEKGEGSVVAFLFFLSSFNQRWFTRRSTDPPSTACGCTRVHVHRDPPRHDSPSFSARSYWMLGAALNDLSSNLPRFFSCMLFALVRLACLSVCLMLVDLYMCVRMCGSLLCRHVVPLLCQRITSLFINCVCVAFHTSSSLLT